MEKELHSAEYVPLCRKRLAQRTALDEKHKRQMGAHETSTVRCRPNTANKVHLHAKLTDPSFLP
eukprot:CAMPEP_0115871930 /NCGR_PEP_ID=MMETSP0287-20121206/23148_1 /TAXON_ID=412157 /ORGANISM="Chrysochromulina rotalis, Strain UIO044" /LENGTH=63 /DNA_ID=CAMNT_0003326803 /DNA_START=27 /DNA_END=218 /DNA_ORIENTATION=-